MYNINKALVDQLTGVLSHYCDNGDETYRLWQCMTASDGPREHTGEK